MPNNMLFSRVKISMDHVFARKLAWYFTGMSYTVSVYRDSLTITEVVIITQGSKAKSCKTSRGSLKKCVSETRGHSKKSNFH